jgi:hypothetical protein
MPLEFAMLSVATLQFGTYLSTTDLPAAPSTVAIALVATAAVLFVGAASALASAIRSQITVLGNLLASAFQLLLIVVLALLLIVGALISGGGGGS